MAFGKKTVIESISLSFNAPVDTECEDINVPLQVICIRNLRMPLQK